MPLLIHVALLQRRRKRNEHNRIFLRKAARIAYYQYHIYQTVAFFNKICPAPQRKASSIILLRFQKVERLKKIPAPDYCAGVAAA